MSMAMQEIPILRLLLLVVFTCTIVEKASADTDACGRQLEYREPSYKEDHRLQQLLLQGFRSREPLGINSYICRTGGFSSEGRDRKCITVIYNVECDNNTTAICNCDKKNDSDSSRIYLWTAFNGTSHPANTLLKLNAFDLRVFGFELCDVYSNQVNLNITIQSDEEIEPGCYDLNAALIAFTTLLPGLSTETAMNNVSGTIPNPTGYAQRWCDEDYLIHNGDRTIQIFSILFVATIKFFSVMFCYELYHQLRDNEIHKRSQHWFYIYWSFHLCVLLALIFLIDFVYKNQRNHIAVTIFYASLGIDGFLTILVIFALLLMNYCCKKFRQLKTPQTALTETIPAEEPPAKSPTGTPTRTKSPTQPTLAAADQRANTLQVAVDMEKAVKSKPHTHGTEGASNVDSGSDEIQMETTGTPTQTKVLTQPTLAAADQRANTDHVAVDMEKTVKSKPNTHGTKGASNVDSGSDDTRKVQMETSIEVIKKGTGVTTASDLSASSKTTKNTTDSHFIPSLSYVSPPLALEGCNEETPLIDKSENKNSENNQHISCTCCQSILKVVCNGLSLFTFLAFSSYLTQAVPSIAISYYISPTAILIRLGYFELFVIAMVVEFAYLIFLLEKLVWHIYVQCKNELPQEISHDSEGSEDSESNHSSRYYYQNRYTAGMVSGTKNTKEYRLIPAPFHQTFFDCCINNSKYFHWLFVVTCAQIVAWVFVIYVSIELLRFVLLVVIDQTSDSKIDYNYVLAILPTVAFNGWLLFRQGDITKFVKETVFKAASKIVKELKPDKT